jgi:hypothetical protein
MLPRSRAAELKMLCIVGSQRGVPDFSSVATNVVMYDASNGADPLAATRRNCVWAYTSRT